MRDPRRDLRDVEERLRAEQRPRDPVVARSSPASPRSRREGPNQSLLPGSFDAPQGLGVRAQQAPRDGSRELWRVPPAGAVVPSVRPPRRAEQDPRARGRTPERYPAAGTRPGDERGEGDGLARAAGSGEDDARGGGRRRRGGRRAERSLDQPLRRGAVEDLPAPRGARRELFLEPGASSQRGDDGGRGLGGCRCGSGGLGRRGGGRRRRRGGRDFGEQPLLRPPFSSAANVEERPDGARS